ncbi:MAG: hypothetical protein ACLQJR_00340, partial [Stellaceae bacterium]
DRKRRRRGRRGGRRRRRGNEPGQEDLPLAGDHPPAAGPIAEQIEYVPPPEPHEDVMRELEAAFTAAPAPSAPEIGVDTVPVSDRGDHLPAPEPAPAAAASPPPAPPAAAPELPTHEVTGPPANPKRGWWRRVLEP